MITILNRKELISTCHMKEQAEICQRLAHKKIPYQLRVINRKSPSPFEAETRARTGTFGEKLELEYQYTIFVHKKDYEYACFAMKRDGD